MSIILKEEAANSVPTPSSGKATLFVDDNGTMSVKDDTGNVSTFPTVATSNTQVLFTDGSAIGGDSDFTWNKNTNVLTVAGNANVGNVNATGAVVASTLTSNVANGTAPLTVTSQTLVANLNADLLDGYNTATAATANTVAVRNADGNITANFFVGNGSQLTGIDATAIQNGTSNVKVFSSDNVAISVNGTANVAVVTSSSMILNGDFIPNANGVYSLGSNTALWKDLHLAGNTLYIADETMQVNASTGIWSFSSNGTNVTLGDDSVFGNTVSANYFLGNGALLTGIDAAGIQNGNSNISVLANGNITVSVAGNANVAVFTDTGLETNDLTVNGNMTTGGGSGGNITGANVVSANTFSGVDLSLSGNAVVGGNLTVNGNLVYVNVETLSVEDPIIELQRGPNGAAPSSNSGKDVGTALNYYDTQAQVAFMGWDVSNAEFGLASQVSISSEVVTFTTYGNLRVGNIIGNGQALTSLPAANISGQVANALVAGTVYTNAQPNITSVGTLGSLAVSGNANVGNIGAAGAVITGNVSAYNANLGNLVEANYVNVTNNLTVAGSANIGGGSGGNISGVNNLTANTLTGALTTAAQPNITSVGTLTSLDVTGNVTAGNVYANSGIIGAGTLVGEGGNISNIQGANVSGAVSTATTAGTVTTNAQPNITSVGTLTSLSVTGNLSAGNADLGNLAIANYMNIAADLTVSGNANIGGGSGGNISGVNNVTANTFTGTLTTNAQPNITSVGTLTSLDVTGNVTAGNVSGGNLVTANYLAGTLTTASQPNITTIGTLSSLAVTGNVTAGNLSTVGALSVTGNANVGNIGAAEGVFTANISALNANLGNLVTANYVNVANDLNVSGNANIGGGSGGNISGVNVVTANTFVGTLQGALANGNSNVNIPAANGNVNISAVGTANVLVITGTGINVAGTLNATGNANVGNIGATNGVFTNVSGNGSSLSSITGANVTGEVSFAATANAVAGANVSGEVGFAAVANSVAGANVSGQVANALIAGTVYTNAQPNITSVGTLTSLDVTGNLSAGNISTAGLANVNDLTVVGNANIGGGSGGNISGANVITANLFVGVLQGSLANGNSNVNIPSANGNVNISAVGTANVLVITGTGVNVAGTLNATGNANVGNLGTAGLITATGNVSGGNITTAGVVSATGNVSGGNLTTAGALSVTGNANVGNIGAAAGVFTGNVSANNLTTINQITAGNGLQVSAGTLTVTNGNLDVTGNINVTGNLNYSNVTDLVVGDPLIYIGANNTGDLYDLGIVASYNNGTYYHTGIARNATDDVWTFFDGVVAEPTTVIDWANATYPTVKMGNLLTTGTANIAGNLTALNANLGNLATANYVNVANDLNVAGNANIGGGSGGNLSGANNISANTFTGTLTTNAQPNITSVGTLTSLGVNGTVTAVAFTANTGVFTGNGSGLSAIAGGNVTGQVANALVAGTVYTAAQPNITSVGTLTSLSVSGNANVGNIGGTNGVFTSVSGNGSALTALNASNISTGTLAQARLANASVTLGSTALTLGSTVTTVAGLSSVTSTTFVGSLSGAATTAGTVTTAAQPNITSVGTLTSLSVSGSLTTTSITTGANTTAGTLTGNWSLSAGSRLQATYADLAEKYVADAHYDPGTVVLFGGELEVTISDEYDSHRVAGVVSTNPAYLMNAGCTADHTVELALQGRVPVKVHGPVAKGDLMVSGPEGRAVANNMARAGTIIGKALENFEGGEGVIEVVVGKV